MENFEEHLMEKYPDLFPKDENGKTTYSSCGIGGYECWEPIIEEMCAYFDSYRKNTYRFQKTKKIWPRVKYFFYRNARQKIYNPLYRLLDPYRGIIPKELKRGKKSYTVKPEWIARAESRKRHLWQKKFLKFFYSLEPKDVFEKIRPQQVVLANAKSKFNTARIYIDGGDEKTYAVAAFVESLCDRITSGELKIENVKKNQ